MLCFLLPLVLVPLAIVVYGFVRLIELLRIGNLEQKAVFITGCDTGFGHQLVLRLLSYKMPVFAGCLTQQGVDELNSKSQSLPGKLDAFLLDVSSDESVNKVAEHLKDATKPYGGLHGVVNNAGIVGSAIFDDFLNVDDYKKAAEVNLFGMIRVTQALKPLVKQTRGRIVNTTSVLGRIGFANLGPYTVSKFGANGYSDVIRQELRPFGVSVHILEPGLFKTPLVGAGAENRKMLWERASDELKAEYGSEIFEAGAKTTEKLLELTGSEDLTWTIDCYFHALTAVFPRVRYHPGWDSQLMYVPFSMLPSFVQDFILKTAQRLANVPKPAAVQKKNN